MVIREEGPGSSFLTVKRPLITTSYFGIMTEGKFDLKLIPEFNSSASGPSVVEWMEKTELVCKMCHMKLIIPLRLRSGAFTIFQQFKEEDKRDFNQINLHYIQFLSQMDLWHLINSSSDSSTMGSQVMFT